MRERESLYKRRRERNERVLVSGVVYREGQRGSGMFLHVEFRLDFRVVLGPFAILESLVPCGVRDFYGTEETWLETGGLWSFSTLFGWITNKFFFFFFEGRITS